MGEPERRRRRLRPPSSATAAAEAPTTETPTAAPGSDPVTGTPVAEDPPVSTAMTPSATTTAVEDPDAAPDPDLTADEAVVEEPAVAADLVPRPTRAGFAARPPRVPGMRPTSGAGAGGDDREGERGLRGLVGSGSSQVSVGAALRARDASRPTDAHLAEAEQTLAIVRRNWLPREDLPRNRP
jgi:hypothetical protein